MRVINHEAVERVRHGLISDALTITEIAKLGGVTRRTVYRWLDMLMTEGADVVKQSRRGEAETYQIVGD